MIGSALWHLLEGGVITHRKAAHRNTYLLLEARRSRTNALPSNMAGIWLRVIRTQALPPLLRDLCLGRSRLQHYLSELLPILKTLNHLNAISKRCNGIDRDADLVLKDELQGFSEIRSATHR